ncbi:MAG: T3SS (YopN, CesT) and YbjN peptide-binding chaperone 1 [Ilumatobacteraceae bacterium]
MSLQTDIARSHLETLIERLTGIHKAAPDFEGDYSVHLRGATFWTRIDGDEVPICRVFAIISDGAEKTSELLDALNSINTRLSFLRAIWVRNQILIEGNHLALTMDEVEFTLLCNDIADASNAFGDRLVADFGGTPHFKVSQDSTYLSVREGTGATYL